MTDSKVLVLAERMHRVTYVFGDLGLGGLTARLLLLNSTSVSLCYFSEKGIEHFKEMNLNCST